MMKKTALVLPVFAALALTSGNISANPTSFDVTVSAVVASACTVTGQQTALPIPSITDSNGNYDSNKDLAATQIATVNCNGPAQFKLTTVEGYLKHSSAGQCSGETSTCLLYNARLSLQSPSLSTPDVSQTSKAGIFSTTGAVSNAVIRLSMDMLGTSRPLVGGTYSEKFTVTVTPGA